MQAPNKFQIALGALTAAIGTIPLFALAGILPSRPAASGDAPAWLGAAIGVAFFLAGIAVIVRSFAGADNSSGELPATAPPPLRRFYDLLVMPVPLLLALLLSWVAFGPGERTFVISGGAGGSAVAMVASESHQLIGRAAFGVGAIVAWFIAGYTVVRLVQQRSGRG